MKYRVEPKCEYCSRGIGESKCRKKAESRGKGHCFRFKYDPLLRVPRPAPKPPEPDPKDFEL